MHDRDAERLEEMTRVLVGGHRARYQTSAPYRHRIDTLARMFLVIAEDAVAGSEKESSAAYEMMARLERDQHPAFLIQGNDVRPVCGHRSPALPDGVSRESCVLDPGHQGPHQASSPLDGLGPMTWAEVH